MRPLRNLLALMALFYDPCRHPMSDLEQLGGSGAAGTAETISYELERRSTGDAYLRTTTAWAPGGQWVALGVIEVGEREGAPTVVDFGWPSTGATSRAEIRAETGTGGKDELRLFLRTGGALQKDLELPGEWAAQGKLFFFLKVDPGSLTYRFGFGVPDPSPGSKTDSGDVVVGALPSAAGTAPVQVWRGGSLAANQSSGTIALSVLDTMPTDVQLGVVGADPTAANLRALVAEMVAVGAVERLGLSTSDAAEVTTPVDPSGAYTWEVVQGSEPVHVAGTLPSYSLGVIGASAAGQSNIEGSHGEVAPPMTLGTYTLSGVNGTDPTANDYGVELGFIAVIDDWTTNVDVSQAAVGGSRISEWIGAGARRTAWYAYMAAQAVPVKHVLWGHGESAAIVEADALAYADDFRTFCDETIAHLGPDVTIHAAELGPLPGGYPHRDTVAESIRTVAAEYPDNVVLVSVDGLTRGPDGVHWDGDSQRALGGRFAVSVATRESA